MPQPASPAVTPPHFQAPERCTWNVAARGFGWIDPDETPRTIRPHSPAPAPQPPTDAVPVIGYHFTLAEPDFATNRRFRTIFGALPSHVAVLQNAFSASTATPPDDDARKLAVAIQAFHGAIRNGAPFPATWASLNITELFNKF